MFPRPCLPAWTCVTDVEAVYRAPPARRCADDVVTQIRTSKPHPPPVFSLSGYRRSTMSTADWNPPPSASATLVAGAHFVVVCATATCHRRVRAASPRRGCSPCRLRTTLQFALALAQRDRTYVIPAAATSPYGERAAAACLWGARSTHSGFAGHSTFTAAGLWPAIATAQRLHRAPSERLEHLQFGDRLQQKRATSVFLARPGSRVYQTTDEPYVGALRRVARGPNRG